MVTGSGHSAYKKQPTSQFPNPYASLSRVFATLSFLFLSLEIRRPAPKSNPSMAEEVQYPDTATNKRKYEDQATPPPPSSGGARRTTGFSAPILSQSPDSGNAPPSYNSVPPPVDEIQLAKQRAQEIAARLFNTAEAKRPRVENGGGFDSNDNTGQKPLIPSVTPTSIPVSYGFQGTSKRIDVPNGRVGVIIGKGGETIKYLQLQSGAKIQVTRDMDADPYSQTRTVELMGTPDQIAKAEQLIQDVLSEAESGGSGIVSRRVTGQQPGAEQFVMKIPNNKVGLVIGKGGETIKNMQARSGARIQVIPLHLPPGDTSMERTLQIDGTSEQIEAAKQLVAEVTSETVIVPFFGQFLCNVTAWRFLRIAFLYLTSVNGVDILMGLPPCNMVR
ncbi:KH domain-containing protein [Actinidia rufa]|uniref:KH domain-containing protein n=1 Tax=Actinidia rufa TaxID=165716 RepID=A0A7J0H0S2_9ERIC|nr:KH domain-containing protein [Actinidia rufa]